MPLPEFVKSWVPEKYRKYLPTNQEKGKYTGPLSTMAEYHALGVGFALGPEYVAPALTYGVGSGTGKCRRSGHLRDAWKELGYTGLGVFLRIVVSPRTAAILPL